MNRIRAWFRDHLIPEARLWWRFWSVRFNALGLAILAWVQFDPVSVLYVYNMMPRPFRALMPDMLFTSLAIMLFALAMIARLVRQPKIEQK
jgi:hypothetical protein